MAELSGRELIGVLEDAFKEAEKTPATTSTDYGIRVGMINALSIMKTALLKKRIGDVVEGSKCIIDTTGEQVTVINKMTNRYECTRVKDNVMMSWPFSTPVTLVN